MLLIRSCCNISFFSICKFYNKAFFRKLDNLVINCLPIFTLVSMGPWQSPVLWRLRNKTIHKALLTHSLLNFTSGFFMIFGRKTCSLIEKAYLHQIFWKVKDWIKESKQFMQPWSRVQVYGMENVEVNDVNSKYDFSLFLNLLDMLAFLSIFDL